MIREKTSSACQVDVRFLVRRRLRSVLIIVEITILSSIERQSRLFPGFRGLQRAYSKVSNPVNLSESLIIKSVESNLYHKIHRTVYNSQDIW